MASTFGDDVLGTAALAASPAILPGPVSWAPPGTIGSIGDFSTGGSLNVPVGPAAGAPSPTAASGPPLAISPPAQTGGGIDPQQILSMFPSQQGGFPTFMSALGAGLSSAGQNWNKPAAAAFASGAGAAIQGGQQSLNQQQDAKLKALHAAIAAWKVGDMAAYHQALIRLRDAGAPRPASAAPPSAAPAASGAAPVPNNIPATAGAGIANRAAIALDDALAQARDAIARGAPREAVAKRLIDNGFDPSEL